MRCLVKLDRLRKKGCYEHSVAEAYQFTALAGVRAVETVLAQRPTGALTPAQAFGADWVLGIQGMRRLDKLQ